MTTLHRRRARARVRADPTDAHKEKALCRTRTDDPFLTIQALALSKVAISRGFVRADLGGNALDLRALGRGVFHWCPTVSESVRLNPFFVGEEVGGLEHRRSWC